MVNFQTDHKMRLVDLSSSRAFYSKKRENKRIELCYRRNWNVCLLEAINNKYDIIDTVGFDGILV